MPAAATIADLYLRLSDARNEEQLEGREVKLRDRAAELGWTVGRVVIENDLVPGNGDGTPRPASAFKRRKIVTPSGRVELRTVRPGFRSILDDLTSGRAGALLVEDLDRMMRQPRDGEDLIDAVELSDATVRSLSGSLTLTEGGTDAERFTARIITATASKSSADTARRVREARQRYAGQSYGGGRRPFGYRADPDAPKYHKRLTVVPAEAKVIEAAVGDVLDRGISLKAVARDLRERGVPSVTGAAWTAETIRDAVVKPTVAGLAVARERDPETGKARQVLRDAPWEAIIERDRWERLTDQLNDPARRTSTGNEPRWLVSLFAVCGECGRPMRVSGGKGRRPSYLGTECYHIRRNAKLVDDYIESVVIERLSRDDAAGLLRPPPRPGIDARKLRAEARKLAARKKAQVRMHAAGDLDDADLAEGMREIRDRLAKIEAQLAASDQADPLAEFRDGRPAKAVWAGLSIARRRAVVQTLIESVVIERSRPQGPGILDPDSVAITPAPGV